MKGTVPLTVSRPDAMEIFSPLYTTAYKFVERLARNFKNYYTKGKKSPFLKSHLMDPKRCMLESHGIY